jgi:glycosyltransferase involved in cell wall biosynthesis
MGDWKRSGGSDAAGVRRVGIAHDWMTTYAGSERCVEEMLCAFPDTEVLTSVMRREALPASLQRAHPSFLQRLPGAARYHEWLLPLMPVAWKLRRPLAGVDAVITSSHACANAVRVAGDVPVLCYCHTPMRYAWNFEAERRRFPRAAQPAARVAMRWFRGWDRKTAERVTRFVANSGAVADRIERFYGRAAKVIHPPVRTDFFRPGGERGDEFLYAGRLVSYKRPDVAVKAFDGLPYRLNIVGAGHLAERLRAEAPPNVSFLGEVSDSELRRLYRTARALVFPGEEDFGIVMAEAQACGTPVIALGRGGALDIVEDGVTGWLVDEGKSADFRKAVRRAAVETLDSAAIHRSAERFSRFRFREEIRAAVEEMVLAHRGALVPQIEVDAERQLGGVRSARSRT